MSRFGESHLGAGGGFDVYMAIPLVLALQRLGHDVHVASLSFAPMSRTSAECVCRRSGCLAGDEGGLLGGVTACG